MFRSLPAEYAFVKRELASDATQTNCRPLAGSQIRLDGFTPLALGASTTVGTDHATYRCSQVLREKDVCQRSK